MSPMPASRPLPAWLAAAALAAAVALAGCGRPATHAAPAAQPAAAGKPKPAASAANGLAAGAPIKGVAVPLPVLPRAGANSAVAVVPVDVAPAPNAAHPAATAAPNAAHPATAAAPKTVPMPVPAGLAGRFAAYRVGLPGGLTYILGPKGMHGSGAVGAHGSFHVTLTGPGPSEMLHIWSDGSCAACSLQSAAAFFAPARRAAGGHGGFHGATIEQFGARVTRPDPQTALFSYALRGGVQVEGLAFYAPRGGRAGLPFVAEVVLGPAAVQRLTPWVLADVRGRLG